MGFGSTSNPYNGPEGVNDHNDLTARGIKTHDQLDVDTDIHGQTLKSSPVADDEVMIEDSEALWAKKKVKASTLAGAGASDHGSLSGLGDDDHSQYHNNTRGDARYAPVAKGVTSGDGHIHVSGDGGQMYHSYLHGVSPVQHHDNAYDPTPSQKAAFDGTHGTPSGLNKFVTDTDPRNSDAREPLPHEHDDFPPPNTVFSYVDGVLTTITFSSGRVVNLDYADGILTSLVDVGVRTGTFSYADGLLSSISWVEA